MNFGGEADANDVDGFDGDQENAEQEDLDEEEAPVARTESKFITVCEFYSHRLQIRSISDTDGRCYFWLFGRLCHQYVVDMYAKIEGDRLGFHRANQDKIRADLYQGVLDAIAADLPATNIGRRIVLPSSFTGGPRYMRQLFQDSMAIVRHFGKPDLFITFTCNPNWPEIIEELNEGETPNDRPDLIVRQFMIKFTAMMKDLLKEQVLGRVVGYTWVIEFQKRGLPHAHILLILDERDKPRTPEDFDAFVSAEIPDPITCPLAYETVTRCMIHGPCGAENPNAPCMDAGKCTKGYPKAFQQETTRNNDGYPNYRRRYQNRIILERNGRQVVIDNSVVVPHNVWLCTKYNAHVNVEICSSVGSVKYVYKYVYKGCDRSEVALQPGDAENPPDIDEIQNYVDARYYSACEALWRIFQFLLHQHSPKIYRLQVHLDAQHTVRFNHDADLQHVLEQNQDSCLMGWFKLNRRDPAAHQYTYPETAQHYTWKRKIRSWQKRSEKRNDKVLGRMYFVYPKDRERYCLRLLLLHVKGAQGYQDIRTVNGQVHNTFGEAALALGLLEDDEEWIRCLEEAALSHSPRMLRHLFAMILNLCAPSEPLKLWDRFAHDLSEDFLHALTRHLAADDPEIPNHVETAKRNALFDINTVLQGVGSGLDRFPELPQTKECSNAASEEDEEDLEDLGNRALQKVDRLNEGQKVVFNRIIAAVSGESQQKLYFVDGPGGTGKSTLFNTLIDYIRGHLRKQVIVVASSGIAALGLHRGTTAHSRFKIPIPIMSDSNCSIRGGTILANTIRDADAIFWDESVMLHRHIFEAVDRSIQDIMDAPDLPFGGKVVVMGGDFRQVLPVVVRGSQAQIEGPCLNRLPKIWPSVESLRLTQNMRVMSNPQNQPFAEFLLRIGEGREETVVHGLHNDFVRIPDEFLFNVSDVPGSTEEHFAEKCLIKWVYSDIGEKFFDPAFLMNRAILTTLNTDVNRLNALATEMHKGPATTYTAQDTIPDEDDAGNYPPEFLSSLEPSGLAPSRLELKVGLPVILLRNMDPKNGLCNGTRLIVQELGRKYIRARIIVGRHSGNEVFLPRIPMDTTEDGSSTVMFRRRQFPLKPAFAMTINKAQGQTLRHVGLYLPQPVFGHGQLYVALSRCTDPKNLKVLINEGAIEGQAGIYTRNVVYRGVLTG